METHQKEKKTQEKIEATKAVARLVWFIPCLLGNAVLSGCMGPILIPAQAQCRMMLFASGHPLFKPAWLGWCAGLQKDWPVAAMGRAGEPAWCHSKTPHEDEAVEGTSSWSPGWICPAPVRQAPHLPWVNTHHMFSARFCYICACFWCSRHIGRERVTLLKPWPDVCTKLVAVTEGWWWTLQGILTAPHADMHGQRASKAERQCMVLAYTRCIQTCFIWADNPLSSHLLWPHHSQ